jgi:16S rRNA (cytosine967-C5)-methyltransferase
MGINRGAIGVQDEGSQLLALLVDAKRGEMVVDFAPVPVADLALGASCAPPAVCTRLTRRTGWPLKPRLARSSLSNVHPVAIAHERDDRIKRLAGKIDQVLVMLCFGPGGTAAD